MCYAGTQAAGQKERGNSMTYEKEIPDFALVPAREPEERVLTPITQGAIYAPVQVTNITEKPKTTFMIEEDILVPDTRPDLKKILMMTGQVHLAEREVTAMAGKDDAVSITGDVQLQTLYLPEKNGVHGPVLSITSRMSFREPGHISLAPGASMLLEAEIEKIEYMVINERKFRVKITMCIRAWEYDDSRIDLFEGLATESLETLRDTVEITSVALRKKDILSIQEDLEIKEGEMPQTILMQNLSVVENYKQASAEKVVVNGFIYISLLYSSPGSSAGENADGKAGTGEAESAEGEPLYLCQMQDRVEFTQFIPLTQAGTWSGSNVCFDGSDLKVRLVKNEEGRDVFRLEGDIITWITLYRNVEKEVITDAYHREKQFVCDFEETSCRTLVGVAAGEATIREVIPLESTREEVEQVIFVSGEVIRSESRPETGKIITEGIVLGKLICKSRAEDADEAGYGFFSLQQEIPFRCVTAVPQMNGEEKISSRVYLKDLWAEKISGKQAEFNSVVLVCSEVMRQAPFQLLKNPAFEETRTGRDRRSMAVYIVRPGDTLWSVARKFQSTVDLICQVNQIGDERLHPGQKLLILR